MIILIPFQLLKLREIIEKEPTKENFQLLQNLIQNDIVESIQANLKVGNITPDDANQLLELTGELHQHIYDHYYALGGCKDMKQLLDGALELPLDKYRIRIDKLEQENQRIEQEKQRIEQENQDALWKAEQEIKKLKAEIEKLKKN